MTRTRSSCPPVLLAFLALLALIVGLGHGESLLAGASEVYDGCTAVAVGRLASTDGSVLTSHTCDSHEGKTWIDVVPRGSHPAGARCWVSNKTDHMVAPGDTTGMRYDHSVPEVSATNGYLFGFYPLMNEHQLCISESTFGGKEILRSEAGKLNAYELTRLLAERCRTAREAVDLAGELLAEFGYNDQGECLFFSDPQEAWVFEVAGPGEGKVGAVWAARRVPDDHVTVNANSPRIRHLDPEDPDCLTSDNIYSVAEDLGLWDPAGGQPLEFCYAFGERSSFASRRREWRVYDLLAPSLELDANQENFPFSIKPDSLVSVSDIMKIYTDTYEDTPFDMTRTMLVTDEDGKMVKSPYANPFMAYDEMPLWKINGGWNERGERTMARSYCIYAFVAQMRSWLPDPIGGLVWFAWDNPAMTCYVPLYNCVTRLPASYRMGGPEGRPPYTRDSAWWAFNRVGGLAAHRWGDTRHDVAAVRDSLTEEFFGRQNEIEKKAVGLIQKTPEAAIEYLTGYSNRRCEETVAAYWQLGDDLWTKYDGRF